MIFNIQGPFGFKNNGTSGLLFWRALLACNVEVARMCVGYDILQRRAFVGTVFVEAPWRRRGISKALHDKAYAWTKEHFCRFESGLINSEENQAYWEDLALCGRAVKVDTDHGPAFVRKEKHERLQAEAG